METPAGELSRSPFDNVLNFVPQGHEKALKQAFYNTAAIIFVIFACGAGIAVYFVLEVFLKPLLWAVLCGTFLHPFKNSLTRLVRNWLRGLGTSYSPLAVGVITLPIKVADSASEALGNFILNYIKLILAVGIGLPLSYVLYHFGPIYKIFCVIETCCVYIYEILGYFSTLWVWSLVAAYLLVVIFYWTEHSNAVLRILSIPVWITLLFHLATIAGSFRIPIVITMITMMIVGFLAEINDTRAKRRLMGEAEDMSPTAVMTASAWAVFTSRNQSRSPSTSPQVSATGLEQDKSKEQDKCKEESAPDMQVPKPPPSPRCSRLQQSSSSQTTVTGAPPAKRKSRPNKEHKVSDSYLMGLVWMCVLVRLWMHVWVLQLLPIPLGYLLIKRLGSHFGVWKFLQDKLSCAWEKVHQFVSKRQDALAPAFIRGLGKLMIRGDRKIISFLEQSLDKVTSILIILLVLIAAVVGTLVAALQVHQESMYLVSATSKLVNETVELNQWLPHRDSMKKAMDSMIGNAYLYGREWIGNKVKHALDGEDLVTSALLEKQVVEIWDKLYAAWKTSNISAPSQSVYKGGVFANWQSVVDTLSKTSGGLKPNDIISFVKENIDTFTSVLESIWIVLKGNLSLAFSAITAVLSLVFGGGTVLLNFLLSFVVFTTALFYLLSASGELYMPVDWFSKFTPSTTQSGSRFGQAVEEAVSGVFAASFKMAAFYGLYTWLLHTIFGVNIVFIPSALAAIFAAIPFLGTYWACVPAVLELWLIHGESVLAILLFVCQLLPTSFIDTAIYSEIKGGGHPYLTGLAIAGGIICLGLEGAIIGPILLCCLIVAVNMYGNMLQDSPMSSVIRPDSKSLLLKRLQ